MWGVQVKCQSDGLAAAAVLQQLSKNGAPAALKALYAGFFSAAVCSVLVGSVHYASFCISKRMALQATAAPAAESSTSADSDGSGSNGHSANLMAATVGAIATALVESPVELFRHQAQAGSVGSNFLQEMVTSVRKNVSWCFARSSDLAFADWLLNDALQALPRWVTQQLHFMMWQQQGLDPTCLSVCLSVCLYV